MAGNAGTGARRKRAGKGGPNPVDVHVGTRVRLRRTLLGMSQEKLAKAVNLTFQQIQKYERGANRIGASRMYDLAHVLDVRIPWRVDGRAAQAPGERSDVRRHYPKPGFVIIPPQSTMPPPGRDDLEVVGAPWFAKVLAARAAPPMIRWAVAASAGVRPRICRLPSGPSTTRRRPVNVRRTRATRSSVAVRRSMRPSTVAASMRSA